jgi:regulator of protease activity HflC (stomatin/prohibitin superfamily)
VLFEDGKYVETVAPGRYAFWKNMAKVSVVPVDMRETMPDVAGQEIMTADKVTLRMNAVITFRVADAKASVSATDDVRQALVPRSPARSACGRRRPGTRSVPG